MTLLVFGELFAEVGCSAADVSMDVARVGEASLTDERVRAEAEAVVVLTAPIAKVVPRFLSGTREIADLVLSESSASQSHHHFDVETRNHLFFRKRHDATVDATAQRGVFVQIQHVHGDMADAAGDRFVERGAK